MLEKLLEIDQVTLDFSDESKLLLNITIGFIMFGVALELKFDDFKKLFDNPKSVIIGIISQFLLMPLLTFVLALTLKSYNANCWLGDDIGGIMSGWECVEFY